MALTDSEEARMELIEETINKLLTWVRNLVDKQQFRQLMLIRQQEIDAINDRLTAIEARLDLITSTLNKING
jgi:hypothetical protein